MMFGLGLFTLINEFEQASNEQLASRSARLQPYVSDMPCGVSLTI